MRRGVRLTPAEEKLLETAVGAMYNAYPVLTDFHVGAAVLTSRNRVYQGCNVESVIAGLGICAERSAINHAIAHGERRIKMIAVAANGEEPLEPCGACRQYIHEFSQLADDDIKIVMASVHKGRVRKARRTTIRKLFPSGMGPKELGISLEKYGIK